MRRAVPAVVAATLAIAAPGSSAAVPRAPSGATGRLLVTMRAPAGTTARAAATAVVAHAGARPAGLEIPQLGVVAVRPRRGESLRALRARLLADPRVRSADVEHRFVLRHVPNDPVFTEADQGPPGTTLAWWAEREGFPAAWDLTRGAGAKVAVIDTGVDGNHPELTPHILDAVDFDGDSRHGPALADEVGHGTHVASLACGTADNALGMAGAGHSCGLLIAKTDLTEGSVAHSLVWAADHGAEAINMSFGTDGTTGPAAAVVQALRYAADRGAVLVAAAADDPVTEQGDPANVLQPTGTGGDLRLGLGLVVTAADASDHRASFAGMGSQVSMAAYGTYGTGGSRGLLGAFPEATTDLERGSLVPPTAPCRCRVTLDGDPRYAYLQGTSMAAPQVAAVAALMRHLNPDATATDVIRILKETARRPAGTGYDAELGWGILDAGAAMVAASRLDRRPPSSRLRQATATGRSILLRWTGTDVSPPQVVPSGILRYELWRSANGGLARRVAVTRRTTLRVRGRRGSRYTFFTIAVDRAGNRERPPSQPDARVRIARTAPRGAVRGR